MKQAALWFVLECLLRKIPLMCLEQVFLIMNGMVIRLKILLIDGRHQDS